MKGEKFPRCESFCIAKRQHCGEPQCVGATRGNEAVNANVFARTERQSVVSDRDCARRLRRVLTKEAASSVLYTSCASRRDAKAACCDSCDIVASMGARPCCRDSLNSVRPTIRNSAREYEHCRRGKPEPVHPADRLLRRRRPHVAGTPCFRWRGRCSRRHLRQHP